MQNSLTHTRTRRLLRDTRRRQRHQEDMEAPQRHQEDTEAPQRHQEDTNPEPPELTAALSCSDLSFLSHRNIFYCLLKPVCLMVLLRAESCPRWGCSAPSHRSKLLLSSCSKYQVVVEEERPRRLRRGTAEILRCYPVPVHFQNTSLLDSQYYFSAELPTSQLRVATPFCVGQ